MTENEAIERLKCMRLFMEINDKQNESKFLEDDYIANKTAIQALEKQISKKPYVQQVVKDFREHDCYECPNCDCFVGYVSECQEEHYQDNYCSNCGQKLDWK